MILVASSFVLTACKTANPGTQQQETEPAAATEPAEVQTTEPEAGAAEELDVYRIAMLADMTSSNVWNLFGPGASTYNYVVQAQYWPTLYGIGDQRLDLVPFLASAFASPIEEEGDFFVSTVTLKDNFVWSDGTEVTADDIAFTAQVVKDFELAGNWGYYVNSVDHIEAIDAKNRQDLLRSSPPVWLTKNMAPFRIPSFKKPSGNPSSERLMPLLKPPKLLKLTATNM